MPQFRYKARNLKGVLVSGVIDADTPKDVLKELKIKNIFPIQIKEDVKSKDISFNFSQGVKLSDLSIFLRQFATLLNAGISISNALDVLIKQTANKKLREALSDMNENVKKGKSLSECMKAHDTIFPDILINMIEAGEVSGTIDRILDRMATYFEKENSINQKVKTALTYPAVVSVVALCVVIFMLSYVLPTFVNLFKAAGAVLPLPTRILLGVSFAITHFWYYLIAIIFLLYFLFRSYANTKEGRRLFDGIKLKLPIFGTVIKKVITSRFTRTLGILLASGIPVIQAMQVVENVVGNKVVEEGLKEAEEGMKQGKGLAKPLEDIGIFQPMVINMIAVGEESGMLDSLLDRTANFFDKEVDDAVTRMTTLLEPVIIVALAVVVGFIIISIVMPMFKMYNTLKF